MESELEIMAKAPVDDPSPSTGRIERAVAHALHVFGFLKLQSDVEQASKDARAAWKTAERLEKRLLRVQAAANSAYQMEVKDEEDL